MSGSRVKILNKLSSQQFLAGTELEKDLGISRAAIWKHIRTLRNQGVPIESVRGKGYRLAYAIDLLDKEKITPHLHTDIRRRTDIHILWQAGSSNNWLRDRLSQGMRSGTVCLAEQQSAGRGTKGRQWVSPLGINLYLSFYWYFDKAPAELGGLSPAIAISIVQTLKKQGVTGLKVKWPNDIYTATGKLGGVLIDMVAETNGPSRVIIGVGLNHGMSQQHQAEIDQTIDDLTWDKPIDMDRSQLAAIIINTLSECCRTYAADGFRVFYQQWQHWDLLYDKMVTLKIENNDIQGVAYGVDESGALLLQTAGGKQHFCSGEVSLKESLS